MLFIITEYFYPISDAGGPIRSIENLINVFNKSHSLKLITSANSHQGIGFPSAIKSDCFVSEPITKTNIYYSKNSIKGYFSILKLLFKNRNHAFFINGLFIPRLSILPALICKNIIISPRGMLINDTLGQKAIFKKFYFFLLRQIISKKAIWHATDQAEVSDVKRFFGENAKIKLITNIPIKPLDKIAKNQKKIGSLKLVYFGLVVEKKGLLILIKNLKDLNLSIHLDIFGSVKDLSYWKLCLNEINQNISLATFNYRGHANPADAQTILANYDAFILLTKGENFGHAIYESLSVGTPVIISNRTPWVFEESSTPGGWLINYNNQDIDIKAFKHTLTNLYHMDNDAYALSSKAAHAYAVNFYTSHDFKKEYTDLFNSFSN